MGIFRRIGLLVFSLAGLASLAALALPWVGPWTQEAQALLDQPTYLYVLAVLVAITALGLLVDLLRALFVRNRKVVVVTKADGDAITITRDAIASQTRHIIEDGGDYRARRIRVKAKKSGHVRVFCRIQPERTVEVTTEGQALHDRIVDGLKVVCGDNIDRVTLEFTDAGEYAQPEDETGYEAYVPKSPTTAAVPARSSASLSAGSPAGVQDATSTDSDREPDEAAPESFEITVPIHSSTRYGTDDTDSTDETDSTDDDADDASGQGEE